MTTFPEYPSILTLFKRNPLTHKVTVGEWETPEFRYLAQTEWLWTEKVDGTNTRVIWDGTTVAFGARNNEGSLPPKLLAVLKQQFRPEHFALVSPKPTVLFGEGFGGYIQKAGKLYGEIGFVLFDVWIDGWWLRWESVLDVAAKLSILVVPTVGKGTPEEAVKLVRDLQSAWGTFPAEGIVLRPSVDLCNRKGERIVAKIKARHLEVAMTRAADRPENIGDIYRVEGYPHDGQVSFGAAYLAPSTTAVNLWTWWLDMDDGDLYEWPEGSEGPDMPYSSISLWRRNPLPRSP